MEFELDHSFGFSMRDDTPLSSGPELIWQQLSGSADDGAGVSALLLQTSPEELADAIAAEVNMTERKRVLRRVAHTAAPAALLSLSKAAAHAYQRPLSPVLSALLDKLADEAATLPPSVRSAADHAFRDLFRDIVAAWSATTLDMMSSGYDTLFGEQAQQEEPVSHGGSVAPEPQRIVELAFETGAMGNVVWTALATLGETQEGVRRILDMIKHAPQGSRAAGIVAQQFANPARLGMLLREEPVDFEAADALLAHMRDAAAPALLDALAEAKSRATRQGLLHRLVAFGADIGPMVAERLKGDERWYVQRNMLTVLREARCSLEQVQLEKFTQHADARVRREATHLLFLDPVQRDRALGAALRDPDVGMLKIALKSARASMPEAVVPILAKRVVDPEFPPEFRTSALQLLARSNSVLALEALLRFAMGGSTLLGKPKLAAKSPEMLISLSGLARTWPNERRATLLLAMARESKDSDIVKAAAPTPRTAPLAAEVKDVLDDD